MIIQYGNIQLDDQKYRGFCDGKDLNLTKNEFQIMLYLLQHHENTITRETLLHEVWGFAQIAETRAADDAMKRLRKKLRTSGAQIKIETLRGVGFYLELMPNECFKVLE